MAALSLMGCHTKVSFAYNHSTAKKKVVRLDVPLPFPELQQDRKIFQ